eukprot:626617-Rhodomonas_salina.1
MRRVLTRIIATMKLPRRSDTAMSLSLRCHHLSDNTRRRHHLTENLLVFFELYPDVFKCPAPSPSKTEPRRFPTTPPPAPCPFAPGAFSR